MENYLNELCQRIKHIGTLVKTSLVNAHHWCVDNSAYRNVSYEVGTIVLNGFFIWIMLFPFVTANHWYFIPSYGIIPWFLVNLKQELFK